MMLRQTLVGVEDAPLDSQARLSKVEGILTPLGIYIRRSAHSDGSGMVVTHVHLSDEHRGREAARALCSGMQWRSTDVALIAGAVSITTYQG